MLAVNNKSFYELQNEHRWRIVKRKKLVLNYCMNMVFTTALVAASANFSPALAADLVASNTLPTGVTTEVGTNVTHTTSQNGRTLDIGMNTNNYVKERWDSFSIGRNATVNINGNSGSTYVGRVISGNASEIYGKLNGAGVNVFLLNTAGITFHGSSQVNVGSLAASTAADVEKNGNQMKLLFNSGEGKVINDGQIGVSDGGFAILAAPYVENSGIIKANLGQIVLASTNAMTLDLRGDGLITYEVTPDALQNAGVKNTGTLRARSGTVDIEAKKISSLTDSVVNLSGVIDADSFTPGENGGTILVSSAGNVNFDNADVRARGQTTGNGGNIKIESDKDINFADTSINVNGGNRGNGGNVVTTAKGLNNFTETASISAKGGNATGDGGYVEISGTDVAIAGEVDLSSAQGTGGVFLLDPANLIIRNGSGAAAKNVVYENFIEGLSQSGARVILSATDSITMEDLADDQLLGGGGAINIIATGNESSILFNDKNDGIKMTYGNILLSAGEGGIDVGSLTTTASEFGLNYGAIYLKTTGSKGDIKTGSITAIGQRINPAGAAGIGGLVKLESAGDIQIDGDVTVKISTSGETKAYLLSSANLIANGSITINGNIDVTSDTSMSGTGTNAYSLARFLATATNGDITITGDEVNVHANSEVTSGDYDILFSNNRFELTAGKNVSVSNKLNIASTNTVGLANVSDTQAVTKVSIIANDGAVSLGDVVAIADSDVTGDANTNTDVTVNIQATDGVTISGNTQLISTADIANSVAGYNASANSNFGINSENGLVSLGDLAITSDAETPNGNAVAAASANIISNDNLQISGNVDVRADSGASDIATSNSTVSLSAGGNLSIDGSVLLAANANGNSASSINNAAISANGDISIGGIDISGNTSSDSTSVSNSALVLNSNGNIDIADDVSITSNSSASSNAIASATANIAASGDVTINGDILLDADSEAGLISTAASTLNIVADQESGLTSNATINGSINVQSSTSGQFVSNALSTATVSATGDIVLNSLVADPRVAANNAVVQQRVSGFNSVTNGTAVLNLTAGGQIRFEPETNGGEGNGGGDNGGEGGDDTNSDVLPENTIDFTTLGGFGNEFGDLGEETQASDGLGNLEPSAGNDVDCDFMNCNGPAV